MNIIYLILLLLTAQLNAELNYSVVYVHLGNSLPEYIFDSIQQTKLFNPKSKIYVICYECNVTKIQSRTDVKCVSTNELKQTNKHQLFLSKTRFDTTTNWGVWRYAIERFFYIESLMSKYNLENVFHLENDNLLYFNLQSNLPLFINNYNGIAAIFDNDTRCIPGFLFIKNLIALKKLNTFIAITADSGQFDMETIGSFRNKYPQYIDNLPLIPNDYKNSYPLTNLLGATTQFPERFSNKINEFNAIFDAAPIGQYLGGLDPFHANNYPEGGFINERAVFNPANFIYEWVADEQGRKVPYIRFNNNVYRINSLHIHSKNLKKFISY